VTLSTFRLQGLVAVVALALALAAPARAQGQDRGARLSPETRTIMPQAAHGDGRSLSDTIRRVQRSTGGQILGAERVPFDGRNINRVKYLDDRGRVRYMDDPVPERSMPRAPRPAAELPPPRGDNP